jgi:hypothetical protein
VFLLFAVAYVVNRYYETKMVAFLARKMLAPRKEEGKAEPTGPKRTGGGGAE